MVATRVELVVPSDAAEGSVARVLRWLHEPGDRVRRHAPVLELETDKVTVEVPAPVDGELVEQALGAGAEVPAGTVLGWIRVSTEADGPPGSRLATRPTDKVASAGIGTTAVHPARDRLSPAVRRRLHDHGLSTDDVLGTGRGGRVTRDDVDRAVAARADGKVVSAAAADHGADRSHSRRIPHGAVRRRIAEHMARSLSQAPHVTAVFEADLTAVLAHRARWKSSIETRGQQLTITAYFVAAAGQALREVPEVNASYHDDAIELHADCNIGIGTALGNDGLVVPVIHGADRLTLGGIAAELSKLTAAARGGRLTPAQVRGGTFTISNHGVSGSLIAAPVIIHQPQVAILGIGRTEKRAVVRTVDGVDTIQIRPMCYVSLSIDHRALDGFQSNAFLASLVRTLECWPVDGENDIESTVEHMA